MRRRKPFHNVYVGESPWEEQVAMPNQIRDIRARKTP